MQPHSFPSRFLAELRPLWGIAWPLIIAQTAQIGTGVVDTLMAGNYSDIDLAAIAVGFNIWLPLYLVILMARAILRGSGASYPKACGSPWY